MNKIMAAATLSYVRLALAGLSLLLHQQQQGAVAFSVPRTPAARRGSENRRTPRPQMGGAPPRRTASSSSAVFSSPDDDWGLDDPGEDPRMEAMRSLLESSWDGEAMGTVPSGPERGAEAAAASIADAMRRGRNVVMVDLRLPSYDISEGPERYDIAAACEFCAFLSDKLRERQLIRKSLVLVRNDGERAQIDRARSEREGQSMSGGRDAAAGAGGTDEFQTKGASTEGSEVDDFRNNLMASWDGAASEEGVIVDSPKPAPETKASEDANSSHRLWSMVGDEEISTGPDQFDQVVAAVDEHAILAAGEDALILLSPYDTADVVAVRRIMARYGQTRTVIIVNSRMETLPRELNQAVLAYGVLPLIAQSLSKDSGADEAGIKVVAMKRFPENWQVYVDVYGDGFEPAIGTRRFDDELGKGLPSGEWIAQQVQAHIGGLRRK